MSKLGLSDNMVDGYIAFEARRRLAVLEEEFAKQNAQNQKFYNKLCRRRRHVAKSTTYPCYVCGQPIVPGTVYVSSVKFFGDSGLQWKKIYSHEKCLEDKTL